LRHEGEITAVAFSSDGNLVLTGGGTRDRNGEAKLWDASTGRLLGPPL